MKSVFIFKVPKNLMLEISGLLSQLPFYRGYMLSNILEIWLVYLIRKYAYYTVERSINRLSNLTMYELEQIYVALSNVEPIVCRVFYNLHISAKSISISYDGHTYTLIIES